MTRFVLILFLIIGLSFSYAQESAVYVDSAYWYSPDASGNIINTQKSIYTYDYIHNLHLKTQTYEINEGSPILSAVREYSYYNNLADKILRILLKYYDSEVDSVINYRLYQYTYNEAGLKTERTIFIWDKGHSQWIGYTKRVYVYAGDDDLYDTILVYSYDTSGSAWVLSSRYVYYYTENLPDSVIYQTYDEVEGWINNLKRTFVFNDFNLMLQSVFYTWNSEDNAWENYRKFVSRYLNDTLLEREWFYGTDSSGSWILEDSILYIYDEQYNLEQRVQGNYKTIFVYTEIPKNQVVPNMDVNYRYFERYMSYLPDSIKNYDNDQLSSIIVFYNSAAFSGLNELYSYGEKDIVRVYPNPVRDKLFVIDKSFPVRMFTISIFDISGRIMLKKEVYNGILDVSSLQPGVYVYRLDDGLYQYSGRFVKK